MMADPIRHRGAQNNDYHRIHTDRNKRAGNAVQAERLSVTPVEPEES